MQVAVRCLLGLKSAMEFPVAVSNIFKIPSYPENAKYVPLGENEDATLLPDAILGLNTWDKMRMCES